MLWIGNPLTSAVVHQYDVHMMSRGTGLAEMRCIGRGWLPRTSTTEHALEDGKTLVVGDDFFQSDGGDVQLRTTRAHVSIALVGAHHDIARFSNTEVGARHTCISC